MTGISSLLQVLVVEDDLGDVALVESAFSEHSLRSELHHVGDGAEAMAFLHRREPYLDAPRPDLILLDLNMPRMNGHEALRAIKQDPELRSIPVVVLTTSHSEDDILTAYDLGANSYITKPAGFGSFAEAMTGLSRYWTEVVDLPPVAPAA